MRRAKPSLLPVPVEPELKTLIQDAAVSTHLSQADVMRSALRIGVPEVVKRLRIAKRPRRDLIEYLDAFAGLTQPDREFVSPSRFK
jgi:hypothetical protein